MKRPDWIHPPYYINDKPDEDGIIYLSQGNNQKEGGLRIAGLHIAHFRCRETLKYIKSLLESAH